MQKREAKESVGEKEKIAYHKGLLRGAEIAKGQWAKRTHGYRSQCCEKSYDECAEYIAEAIRAEAEKGGE